LTRELEIDELGWFFCFGCCALKGRVNQIDRVVHEQLGQLFQYVFLEMIRGRVNAVWGKGPKTTPSMSKQAISKYC
jgi:hypothetical protein